MSLTTQDVARIALLARIDVSGDSLEKLKNDLSGIFAWIEQLKQVNVEGVVPFTDLNDQPLFERQDVVNDGNQVEEILKNAPDSSFEMFSVPKVIE